MERLFSICIEEKVEKCTEIIETQPEKSAKCVVQSFKQCAEEAPLHDKLSIKAMEEAMLCIMHVTPIAVRDCFLQWYDSNVKK